jgi:Ser/Thr protein kinase RdoA (MazF antagonist)
VTGDGIDRFVERMYSRTGLERLPAHLEGRYGIRVAQLTELDLGVFRVDRSDGPSWVARVFPSARPLEQVEGDAEILRALARERFPAERCAHTEAVSTHEGQGVLVTEFVEGPHPDASGTFGMLGELLGRLNTLQCDSGAVAREGGAWHHLSLAGGPRQEIADASSLLADAEPRVPAEHRALYEELRDALERADDLHDLPQALIHPDFVPVNAIASPDDRVTVVDWTGAGRGPRIWSLAFLLWAARGPKRRRAVIGGYRSQISLEPNELARLPAAISVRPLIFGCWAFCTGRQALPEVIESLSATRRLAAAIEARVEQGPKREDDA